MKDRDQMALDFSGSPRQLDSLASLGAEALSDEERRVIDILRSHSGRELAIKAPDLAGKAGVTPRQLRELIGHLIEFHGIRIGSTTRPPYGYYIVVDQEDLKVANDHLKSKALSCLRRMSVLNRLSMAEVVGQLSLDLEKSSQSGLRSRSSFGGVG